MTGEQTTAGTNDAKTQEIQGMGGQHFY